MGVVLGLLLGAGLLGIWLSFFPATPRVRRLRAHPLQDLLTQAGWFGVAPHAFVALSLAAVVVVSLLVWAFTGAVTVALAFGLIVGLVPTFVVQVRAERRRTELRGLWPDAIDDLLSSVRAGMSLPEALIALGERGPEELRGPFQEFARDYRVTARIDSCFDLLKDRFADPVADRIVEALRLTRQVGGTDLGRTLRALAAMLREEQRTRGELEARQSWTVNSARMAVAAPWVVLALLTFRTEAASAFNSGAGAAVLAAGAGACAVAYWLMLRIGKLPEERRVFR